MCSHPRDWGKVKNRRLEEGFGGTYTAIVTPFKRASVDEAALKCLIEAQIAGGVDGIVPLGRRANRRPFPLRNTSGSELAVQFAGERIKVLTGTGANATSEAVLLTQAAEKVGARISPSGAILQQTDTGRFVSALQTVANTTCHSIILYSIPGGAVLKSGLIRLSVLRMLVGTSWELRRRAEIRTASANSVPRSERNSPFCAVTIPHSAIYGSRSARRH